MNIAIIGAGGAIGGLLACYLIKRLQTQPEKHVKLFLVFNGEESIAYKAVRKNAYILRLKGVDTRVSFDDNQVTILTNIEALENSSCDYIISTVPATAITETYANKICSKLNQTSYGKIILAQNGIPCWFLNSLGDYKGEYLVSIDPQGKILKAFGINNIIGAVLHMACSIVNESEKTPWTVDVHKTKEQGMKLILGSPTSDNAHHDDRLNYIKDIFQQAGLPVTIVNGKTLASEVLKKMQINVGVNPLSAITQLTVTELLENDLYRSLILKLCLEVGIVAKKLRCPCFNEKELNDRLAESSNHMTSMAQHLINGKPLEHPYMLKVLIELNNLITKKQQWSRFFGNTSRNSELIHIKYMQEILDVVENRKFDHKKKFLPIQAKL